MKEILGLIAALLCLKASSLLPAKSAHEINRDALHQLLSKHGVEVNLVAADDGSICDKKG